MTSVAEQQIADRPVPFTKLSRKLRSTLLRAFPHFCFFCQQEIVGEITRTDRSNTQNALEPCVVRDRPICDDCWRALPHFQHSPFTHCIQCAEAIGAYGFTNNTRRCAVCELKPPPYQRITSGWLYSYPLNSLIRSFKQQGSDILLQALMPALRHEISLRFQTAHSLEWHNTSGYVPPSFNSDYPDYVVPIPQHWSKTLTGKTNAAHKVAEEVAAELQRPLLPALTKQYSRKKQKSLSLVRRRANLRNAFAFDQSHINRVRGSHIVLVDDVMTTGATLQVAAKLLKAAGAKYIEAFVLARRVKF